MNIRSIELTEVFTEDGIKKLSKGQTLGFKQEDGSIQSYKISKISKNRVWAKPIILYLPEDLKVVENKWINKVGKKDEKKS